MSNEFSKEERVAFEDLLESFNDELILSRNVSTYRTSSEGMQRSNDIIWRPMPYIMQSFDGLDQSGNFPDVTQLSVPAVLGFNKSSNWKMDAKELRDKLQEGRLFEGAKQKLASDVNIAIMNVAALQGTLVVKNTGAPSSSTTGGYTSVAECDAIMNEQGVPMGNRYAAFSSRVYNGLAADLAQRETVSGKVLTAYDRSYIGPIAGFDAFKLDYANRLAAAVGALTVSGANQYYTPVSTRVAATGEQSNVDNRYQTLTVNSTTGVVAGNCFNVANVYSVHHITKNATSQLKTFRVISVPSPTTMVISPPMVSAEGATPVEKQYQNVDSTPADGAAITWLNTVAADINPFWHKDSIEILPANLAVEANAGASVMRGTTENGIEIVTMKQMNIDNTKVKFRCDIFFGVCNKQPEMNGIIIYNQT